jgi:hypothetical protein
MVKNYVPLSVIYVVNNNHVGYVILAYFVPNLVLLSATSVQHKMDKMKENKQRVFVYNK